MNGNLTREGITADLEAMRRAGIGGALIMEVGNTKHQRSQMAPAGPVAFASPAWCDLFQHTLAEAARLGLEISMNNDAGWCGSGGPWNQPEFSMQKLVWTTTLLEGPGHCEVLLPQPKVKRQNFYRDVKTLAYPAPGDQPVKRNQVIDLSANSDASGQLAWDVPAGRWVVQRIGHCSTGRTNHPAPEAGLGLECDKFSAEAIQKHFEGFIGKLASAAAASATASAFAMTHVDSWEVGEQNWTARLPEEFRQRRGYDLTPWLIPLTVGSPLESAELTQRFQRDFKRTQSELLCEKYAGTLRSLANRRGLQLSIEAYGPDGCFLNPLNYGAAADLPMAEFWVNRWDAWHRISPRLLASAAHATGKTVVGAESFTASPQNGNWNDHPYTLKSLGDWAFSEGINRMVLHRMVLQPWLGHEPGMTFGPFGTHFDRNQTWWEPGAAFFEYLARCQFLLQQGQFVADVCRLVPDGENYGSRGTMEKLPGRFGAMPAGYNFDYLSDTALSEKVTVKDHRLVLPSGMSYRVLQLPESGTITPGLLRRIRDLVSAGATMIGAPPRRSPSLQNYPHCDEEVQALAAELWGNCDGKTVTENGLGAGKAVWGKPLETVLRDSAVPPDLLFTITPALTADALRPAAPRRRKGASEDTSPRMPTTGLNWIHRRTDQGDVYFLANPQHRPVDALCTFRISGLRPELWNPETGAQVLPAAFVSTPSGITLPIHFPPVGSTFVIFRHAIDPAHQIVTVKRDGTCLFGEEVQALPVPLPELWCEGPAGVRLEAAEPGTYEVVFADGRAWTSTVAARLPAMPLPGPWHLKFQPGRGAPDAVSFPKLTGWTEHAGEGIRYFSGTASYSCSFEAPAWLDTSGAARSYLDLGRVEVMAEVVLNGRSVGVLWKPPFTIEVSKHLRPGRNELTVKITNLWANRLIGDERYPDDCTPDRDWQTGPLPAWPSWFLQGQPRPEPRRLTFTTWKYYTESTPLLPSGWLGPLSLLASEVLQVK